MINTQRLFDQVWCSKVEQGSSYDSWNMVKDSYKRLYGFVTASPKTIRDYLNINFFRFFLYELLIRFEANIANRPNVKEGTNGQN